MSRLSLFMRYNESSVLNTFTKDARNDHLAFEDKPGVSRICRKPCSILLRSTSAFSIDVYNGF